MKKIVFLLIALLIAVAGYYFTQSQSHNKRTNNSNTQAFLEKIPSDTLFLSASFEPFPLQDILSISSHPGLSFDFNDIKNQDINASTPGAKILLHLFTDYMTNISNTPEKLFEQLGVSSDVISAFYNVGLHPVLRMQLDDVQKMKDYIKTIEQTNNISAIEESIKGVEIKKYLLTEKGAEEKIDLVLAFDQQSIIVTLKTFFDTNESFEIALGAIPPSESLAQSGLVEQLVKKYNYKNQWLTYMNNQVLAKAFTSNTGLYAEMLNQLMAKEPSSMNQLSALRNPDCEQEIGQLAEIWPFIVSGYRDYQISKDAVYLDASTTIVMTDNSVLEQFKKLQGFIPSFMSKDFAGMLGLAIGFDSNQFLPTLTSIWQSLSAKNYRCAPLQMAQQSIVQQNPAAMGMVVGMMAGLQGISVSVNDFQSKIDPNTKNITPESLDVLVTVSAQNPDALFMSVTSMIPGMQGLTLPQDGSAMPIPLPLPLPINEPIQITKKGNHIALFVGPKSEKIAMSLEKEPLNQKGFSFLWLDYKHYFEFLAEGLQSINAQVAEQTNSVADLEKLKDLDMQLGIDFNISEHGFSFGTIFEMKKPPHNQSQ